MNWTDRFNAFPMTNLIGWCVICAVWLGWEIWGATHAEGATFTYLIRNSAPKWAVLIAWVTLGWHFLWYDSAWWLSFIAWLKRLG
jgi:hypothetical protein